MHLVIARTSILSDNNRNEEAFSYHGILLESFGFRICFVIIVAIPAVMMFHRVSCSCVKKTRFLLNFYACIFHWDTEIFCMDKDLIIFLVGFLTCDIFDPCHTHNKVYCKKQNIKYEFHLLSNFYHILSKTAWFFLVWGKIVDNAN